MFSRPGESLGRRFVALGCAISLLGAALLSAAPQWHARLHADADAAQHRCVVTLVAAGHFQAATPTPIAVEPFVRGPGQPLPRRSETAFVFLRVSSILEHAPPSCA